MAEMKALTELLLPLLRESLEVYGPRFLAWRDVFDMAYRLLETPTTPGHSILVTLTVNNNQELILNRIFLGAVFSIKCEGMPLTLDTIREKIISDMPRMLAAFMRDLEWLYVSARIAELHRLIGELIEKTRQLIEKVKGKQG